MSDTERSSERLNDTRLRAFLEMPAHRITLRKLRTTGWRLWEIVDLLDEPLATDPQREVLLEMIEPEWILARRVEKVLESVLEALERLPGMLQEAIRTAQAAPGSTIAPSSPPPVVQARVALPASKPSPPKGK